MCKFKVRTVKDIETLDPYNGCRSDGPAAFGPWLIVVLA